MRHFTEMDAVFSGELFTTLTRRRDYVTQCCWDPESERQRLDGCLLLFLKFTRDFFAEVD